MAKETDEETAKEAVEAAISSDDTLSLGDSLQEFDLSIEHAPRQAHIMPGAKRVTAACSRITVAKE